MKILLAEDEPAARAYLEKQLQRLGYDVLAVEDGVAAWDAYERRPVELVMTDIMMPRVDGLELCRRIRSVQTAPLRTYVILVTALAGKKWYLKGLEAGADDFLTKPATFYELVVRLSVAEQVLHLERGMRHLEGLLGVCPSCRFVPAPDGRWTSARGYLASVAPPDDGELCPACHDSQEHADQPLLPVACAR